MSQEEEPKSAVKAEYAVLDIDTDNRERKRERLSQELTEFQSKRTLSNPNPNG